MPKPPRAPRRRLSDDDGTFGDLTPWNNPSAVYAYRCSVVGLIPIVGMFTGLAAIVLGIVGIVHNKFDRVTPGYAHARIAVGLGLFEVLANVGGLMCIAHGFGWI